MDVPTSFPIVILLGRPGSGKSTLFNSLAGKVISKSGSSIGNGLSRECASCEVQYEGRTYTIIDTPGFPDVDMTTKEIFTKILAEIDRLPRGPIKFCFFTKLDAYRITDETVLNLFEATNVFGSEYSIVYSDLHEKGFSKFKEGGFLQNSINTGCELLDADSAFIETNNDLVGEDDIIYDVPVELKKVVFEQNKKMEMKGEPKAAIIKNGANYYSPLLKLKVVGSEKNLEACLQAQPPQPANNSSGTGFWGAVSQYINW